MQKSYRTPAMILVALLPVMYLLFVWPSLPQTVPMHFGADMQPDKFGPKSELWIPTAVLSLVSVGVYFLLISLHRFDPKQRMKNQPETFRKLAAGLVIFMAALNVLILTAVRGTVSLQSFLFPLLGLMFACIGNYMNNIKPNYFAGIRLPWTLNNDENWRLTHSLAGKLWFAGGLLLAVTCLFLPVKIAFGLFISVTVVMVLIPVVYSYRLFKKGL